MSAYDYDEDEDDYEDEEDADEDYEEDGSDFRDDDFYDPGGRSALRAGDRKHPCPTCKEPNRLTAADIRHGYQCDECADRAEGYGY